MAILHQFIFSAVLYYAVALQEFESWMEIEAAKPINRGFPERSFNSRLSARTNVLPELKIRGIDTVDMSVKQPTIKTSEQKLPEIMERLGLNQLLNHTKELNLTNLLNSSSVSLTIFAPTDAAFKAAGDDWKTDKLNIILHHVLSKSVMSFGIKDEKVYLTKADSGKLGLRTNIYSFSKPSVYTASGAVITSADHLASNGVIHILDRLHTSLPRNTLSYMVNATGMHKTLYQLLNQTGLVSVLNNNSEPYTLLAPNDNAFSKLPASALKALQNNTTLLKKVLLRHVIPMTYYSAGVVDNLSVKTASDESLVWLKGEGGVTVYSDSVLSNVNMADRSASNGVFHCMDTVIYNLNGFKMRH